MEDNYVKIIFDFLLKCALKQKPKQTKKIALLGSNILLFFLIDPFPNGAFCAGKQTRSHKK